MDNEQKQYPEGHYINMSNTKKISFINIILKSISGVAFVVGFNLLLAGRWDYTQGWVFSALMFIVMVLNMILFRDKLDLAQERLNPGKGVKAWDKLVFSGFTLFILIAWVIGALDTGRYGWTGGFPLWAYIISYLVYIYSIFMFTWPMLENRWFSSMVRIQSDRGQKVCDTGPYKYIRHPGYVGGIFMALSTGLVFGSIYAIIPGIVAAVLLLIRTHLEDKVLLKELPGYLEYSKKVKYRLMPGVW